MKTSNYSILKIVGILLAGVLLGWLIFGGESERVSHDHTEMEEGVVWTCSMHPQIRQTEAGDCPICGMDLIPLEEGETGAQAVNFQMSESALKLANVTTEVIGGRQGQREIRLNGKVQVDERNAYAQSSHIPGRIEQLTVNFTGERVQRGQTLATVYSPQLVTAQEELLQAARIRESQPELFEAAKEKMRSWKIGQNQIEQIINTGRKIENFPIRADVSGVVTEKMVNLGDYVERGMPIYEIADLSKVWVLFDLYESDLAWVEEGDVIEYTINSIPGETFQGKIDYIDPIINSQTRVATARVEVENKEGRLKPEMFVSGVVTTSAAESAGQQIVIPKSAVLWTGTRSVVYVREGTNGFEMREVTLGPGLGDSYIVQEGLQRGEEIVTNGTFTVDAAVQLSGRPSMMNPSEGEGGGNISGADASLSEADKAIFAGLLQEYLQLKNALVADNSEAAKKYASALRGTISEINSAEKSSEAQEVWDNYRQQLNNFSEVIEKAGTISEQRTQFDDLSNLLIQMVQQIEPTGETLYVQHCPMADNDRGAYWLSLSSQIENPYFGEAMLTCGEVKSEIN